MKRLLFALLLAGCAPQADQAAERDASRAAKPTTAAAPAPTRSLREESVEQAVNAFGLALYDELAAEAGNLFLSPLSIEGAFGPVVAGARGETQEAISRSLRLPAGSTVHAKLGGLLRGLESSGDGTTLAIANALWVQRGFPLKPEFVAMARRHYDAPVESLDFAAAPDAAAERINAWVRQETRRRIERLVTPPLLGGGTRLVVTNAVYFLGDWELPFEPRATTLEPFHLAGGGTTTVPLMYRMGRYRYLQGEGWQAIDLPYRGGDLAMTVFLPSEADRLSAFERGLDLSELRRRLAELDATEQREVRLFLPRAELEEQYNLVPPLDRLGMGIAFSPEADFVGIADAALRIAHVVHKTYLRIDEQGTEAAAATAVIMPVSAPPEAPPVFRADRPFFFLIRDRKSGTILFLGRMARP